MRHTHYIVQGYEGQGEGTQLLDVATVDVLADSEKDALKRAAKFVSKKHYRVSSVIEHNPRVELDAN